MAHFFTPDQKDDGRMHAPATANNRDFILKVLQEHLPDNAHILEVASGTGEHGVHMCQAMPNWKWQPTDLSQDHINSIEAWKSHAGLDNLLDPHHLDATSPWDLQDTINTICCMNMIHISPWEVCQGLMENAGQILSSGDNLYLYGPYKMQGAHISPSNEAFDASLKKSDPSWGVRDLEAVAEAAISNGFTAPLVIAMPANNHSLIFTKV